MQITAKELAALLGGVVDGNPDAVVSNLAKIEEAQSADLSFIANPKYETYAATTGAGILIVNEKLPKTAGVTATLVRVPDPYAAFTKLLSLYNQQTQQKAGVEQPCFIAEDAEVSPDAYIGAFSYLGRGVKVGSGCKIYPNTYLGDGVTIGDGTTVYANVAIYHACKVGCNVIIHAGTVIGSDGFGFAPNPDGSFNKIPQTGNVVIEDDVEIGANCTIDRATLGSTVIRKGVKLDNLIQIAHNVEVGPNSVIAAQAGVSGSTKLGANAMIGGQVGIVGHIQLADGIKVQAQSGISKSIRQSGSAWAGSPAFNYQQNLKSQVIFRNLPELEQRVRDLEARLASLGQNKPE